MSEPATPPEPRAARPSSPGAAFSVSGSMSRKTLVSVLVLLTGGTGYGLYSSKQAEDRAGEAKSEVRVVKHEAKADVAELAGDVKEKLDPTADVATQVATECATRAEVDELRKASKAEVDELRRALESLPLSGRRRWRGRREREREVRIEVPPEVKAPLPVPTAPEAKP